MKVTGSLILVLIGISSCDNQDERQLNRVLVGSVESIQRYNAQTCVAVKEKSNELRFEVERLRRNGQQQNNYFKLNAIYDRYLHIDSVCDNELARLDTLRSVLLQAHQIKKSVVLKNYFPQLIDFSQLTHDQLQEQVGDFFLDKKKIGVKVYLNLKTLRNHLTDFFGSYERNGMVFQMKSKSINRFETKKELLLLTEKMVENSAANLKEDKQVLIDVYAGLSYPEMIGGVSWEQAYFENSSLLSALAIITTLQNDILHAKQLAVYHCLAFGCQASYPFNEIQPIAVGPLVARENDSIELKVTMGAFDTSNIPVVTLNNMSGRIHYPGDGTGRIRLKLHRGMHRISGTISIQNRSGVYKTANWEYQIHVSD